MTAADRQHTEGDSSRQQAESEQRKRWGEVCDKRWGEVCDQRQGEVCEQRRRRSEVCDKRLGDQR